MSCRFYHYSDHEIKRLKREKYSQWAISATNKPCGFWVSIEGEYGWEAWCKSEGFRLEDLAFKYEVTLKSDAKILKICNKDDMVKFYEKYKVSEEILEKIYQSPKYFSPEIFIDLQLINWIEVAKDYQGLYIETFSHKYKILYNWIWGWDCISACIWDLSCIKKLKLLDEPEKHGN